MGVPMGRKTKKGLDYSPWDTDLFENDTKIDELIDAQGWIGFSIYFYLCQKAYASDGYFYRWSYANAPTTARKMGGGIGSETVRQTVAVCLRNGLFDKRLFDLGVLSSKGIQRRYAYATRDRRVRVVDRTLWLLDPEESNGIDLQDANEDLLSANEEMQEGNDHKSKVKESKVKESKEELDAPAREEISSLVAVYEHGCGIMATQYFAEQLQHFVPLLGYEVVKHGIEAAFGEGKTSPKYILAILRRYEHEKLDTLEKVEMSEQRFEQEKQRKANARSGARAQTVKKPEEYTGKDFFDDD